MDKIIHPGEILEKEQMALFHVDIETLAERIEVPVNFIQKIIDGKANLSTDIACRLGYFFCTSPDFWTDLQADHDIRVCEERNGDFYRSIEPFDDPETDKRLHEIGLLN